LLFQGPPIMLSRMSGVTRVLTIIHPRKRVRLRREPGQLRAQRLQVGEHPQPAGVDPAARRRLLQFPQPLRWGDPPQPGATRSERRRDIDTGDRPLPHIADEQAAAIARNAHHDGATLREEAITW